MVSVTRGKYDSIKVEHHATVSTEKECKAKGQWKTYKEMVDKEGEEGLLVMLASKAISMRDHPRLLGTGIPYPRNQQFLDTIEVGIQREKRDEGLQCDQG